jgi:hypothetical protein
MKEKDVQDTYPYTSYDLGMLTYPSLYVPNYTSHIPARLPNQRQRRKLAAQNRRIRVKK